MLSVPVRQAVEAAVSAKLGVRVQIADDVQNFWPSSVFRCRLRQSPGGMAPKTVIVRVPREGTVRTGRTGLANEQAALQYLMDIGSTLVPRFLAGSSAAGFVVTDDLGNHPSLLALLLGKDPESARLGMIAFARGLGMLHAQTAGPPESLRVILPITPMLLMENWRQVQNAVMKLVLPLPSGANSDIEAVTDFLAEPAEGLSLSSGDCSVVNCQISGGQARFFDFEEACFRHPLLDAVVLRYSYPTGGPPWRLPSEAASQSETAYRLELAKAFPAVRNDRYWEHSMAAAVAAWTILRLVRLPKVDAGPDRDSWQLLPPDWSAPTPIRSRRRQLVSILETCIASSRRAGTFETFADWCERLAEVLRERWPEASEELRLYPAFL